MLLRNFTLRHLRDALPLVLPATVAACLSACGSAAPPTFSVRILTPAQGSVVAEALVTVNVQVGGRPIGAGFQYALDGRIVMLSKRPQIKFGGVDEGYHTITVNLLDQAGAKLAAPASSAFQFVCLGGLGSPDLGVIDVPPTPTSPPWCEPACADTPTHPAA